MKRIHVLYFASLKDAAKKGEEVVQTEADTPGELYDELIERYNFPLEKRYIRAAIDNEFAQLDDPLPDHAQVVFIPPVAGG
jgi:molybdopterin synthase sulfur carrier subunit